MNRVGQILDGIRSGTYRHIDKENPEVRLAENTLAFVDDPDDMPIVCANAYLGYRAIKKGLDAGADIIICGRVSDTSPVIAAAAWWHQWSETDYDLLAGALVAGHLIECSTYVTGANFAGGYQYPVEALMDLGLPIVEVFPDGQCVVTKHEALKGLVTSDTVKCQLLYEIQGNIFLHSDVKADLANVTVTQESVNRVRVSGVSGHPPPSTTKLAVFYQGGYQCEILVNANGYATDWKYDFHEAQLRSKLEEWDLIDKFDVLDFQRVGRPMENPDSQLASTTCMRIFAQAKTVNTLKGLLDAWLYNGMAHFAGRSILEQITRRLRGCFLTFKLSVGMHYSLDFRTAMPRPFVGFYPALIPQSELEESVSIITADGALQRSKTGPPLRTQPVQPRENYEPTRPMALDAFGPTVQRPLGDIVLGRSGDKGGNINCGLYVQTADQWDWLRSFLTRGRMKELMGKDWRERYFVERVELPHIYAVHYVIYGPLGTGVSSSKLLDNLGKGFAEFIRAVHVPLSTRFLEGAELAEEAMLS